jgi:hypothetical protein
MTNDLILSPISLDDFKTVLRDCIKTELTASAPSQLPPQNEDLITEKEARGFLHVSKVTMKKWRDDNIIPYYKIGTRIRYKRSELVGVNAPKKYGRGEK